MAVRRSIPVRDRRSPLYQRTMLRPRDDEIGWHVLADPEGNEFCVV